MAYTTINKSTDYFNTKLYTGNASSRTISGIGFQPDFTWSKNRGNDDNHYLYDAVRGATKYIMELLLYHGTGKQELVKVHQTQMVL